MHFSLFVFVGGGGGGGGGGHLFGRADIITFLQGGCLFKVGGLLKTPKNIVFKRVIPGVM